MAIETLCFGNFIPSLQYIRVPAFPGGSDQDLGGYDKAS